MIPRTTLAQWQLSGLVKLMPSKGKVEQEGKNNDKLENFCDKFQSVLELMCAEGSTLLIPCSEADTSTTLLYLGKEWFVVFLRN